MIYVVYLRRCLSVREELELLNKDNEHIQSEMESLREETREHKRKRSRVEKVLADAASSIKIVLTVSRPTVITHSLGIVLLVL